MARRKKSSKEKGLQVIDREHRTQCWLSQSITPFLLGQNLLPSLISRFHIQPDSGLFPCVIVVKGKVTFCRLMGFLNNEQIWKQQKRFTFHSVMEPLRHCGDAGRLQDQGFHYTHCSFLALGQGDSEESKLLWAENTLEKIWFRCY